MSKAREDVYQVAALLAELDRILNPLPGGSGGAFRIEPSIPPPLPPSTPPQQPGGPTGPSRGVGGLPTPSFSGASAVPHSAAPPSLAAPSLAGEGAPAWADEKPLRASVPSAPMPSPTAPKEAGFVHPLRLALPKMRKSEPSPTISVLVAHSGLPGRLPARPRQEQSMTILDEKRAPGLPVSIASAAVPPSHVDSTARHARQMPQRMPPPSSYRRALSKRLPEGVEHDGRARLGLSALGGADFAVSRYPRTRALRALKQDPPRTPRNQPTPRAASIEGWGGDGKGDGEGEKAGESRNNTRAGTRAAISSPVRGQTYPRAASIHGWEGDGEGEESGESRFDMRSGTRAAISSSVRGQTYPLDLRSPWSPLPAPIAPVPYKPALPRQVIVPESSTQEPDASIAEIVENEGQGAVKESVIIADRAVRRRMPIRLWAGSRGFVEVDPQEASAAEKAVERQYQDRLRWRLR